MTIAVSLLPEQQLAALNAAYRQAVARKRLRLFAGAALFIAALILAAVGAEVNLRTLFTYFGNFVSYFDRILTLDSGQRVWTDPGEWLWGWYKWGKLLGETLLISYVGTLIGAVCAFCLNFFAAENTSPAPWLRFTVRRLLEFARTVPGIVFARGWVLDIRAGALIVLGINAWIIASWSEWQYGAAFGHRAFIDCFPILAMFLAEGFAWLMDHPRLVPTTAIAITLATALSVAQMIQYWHHIWPTRDITWDQYRALFLTFR